MDRIDQKAIKVASAGITVYNVSTAVLRALWYKVVRAVLCVMYVTDGWTTRTDRQTYQHRQDISFKIEMSN